MNKMLVLQVGLLVSFGSMNGMETIKGLLGMNRAYSCDYQRDGGKKEPISVKIVTNQSGKGFWFSKEDKYHDVEKGIFALRLGATGASIEAKGEFRVALMKAIAAGGIVSIETVRPGKKESILWQILGDGNKESQQWALKSYQHQTNNSLKSANKDIQKVTIKFNKNKTNQLNTLQNSSIFNPFDSFSVDGVYGFTIPASEDLLDLLKTAALLDEKNMVIKRNYGENQIITNSIAPTSDNIVLDVEATKKQTESHKFMIKWRNRLFGASCITILALLAYFKLNQK